MDPWRCLRVKGASSSPRRVVAVVFPLCHATALLVLISGDGRDCCITRFISPLTPAISHNSDQTDADEPNNAAPFKPSHIQQLRSLKRSHYVVCLGFLPSSVKKICCVP